MRNGTVGGQYTRGRADEVAVYGTAAVGGDDRLALPGGPRRQRHDGPRGARRPEGDRAAGPRRSRLERRHRRRARRLRRLPRHERRGPIHAGSTSSRPAPPPTQTPRSTGGTIYVYVVTASDIANHRGLYSSQGSATPPSTTDLLRTYAPQLRYETQETYFADSAAEMTDNYVAGSRQTASSTAAARGWPQPTPPTRSRTCRSPSSAIPVTRTAAPPPPRTTSTRRTPTTSRMRNVCAPPATGPHLRPRRDGRRQDVAAVLAVLLLQPPERARL